MDARLNEGNLRHRTVILQWGGRRIEGVVITRICGSRWMVETRLGREVLDRSEFEVVD